MKFRKDLQWALVPQILEASLDPDLTTSSGLRAWVKAWAGGADRHAAALEQVRLRLKAETGTFLEPFSLSPAELSFAMTLAAAYYSALPPTASFRIVSRTSGSNKGGLEFDLQGNFLYRERFAFGLRGCEGEALNFYAPSFRPKELETRDLCRPTSTVTLRLAQAGLELRVQDGARFAPGSHRDGLKFDDGLSTARVGLQIKQLGNDLVLTAETAEAMIRLEALCADGQCLELGDKLSCVCLRPLEGEEPTVLDSLVFAGKDPVDAWLTFPWDKLEVPDLPESLLPHQPRLFRTLS